MRDVLSLAWKALSRHKLRGLLAVCGVAIGITAITGIISAETSWSKALDATFAQLGITKVAVDPPAEEAKATRRALTLDDVEAIRRSCSLVKSMVPISWAGMDVKVGSTVRSAVVKGAGVGIEGEVGIEILSGRKLSAADVAARAPGCLIAAFVAEQLFGPGDATGKVVRIAGRGFTIVGTILDNSGDHHYRRAMVGERAEIYIPITTAQRIPPLNGVRKIIVEADDQAGAARQIDLFMQDRLRARADAKFATCAATMKEAALRSRRRVSLFVGLAGVMALLVAGMGVGNLLFVSVVERSSEIGLRRALGASSWAVAWQFLAESLLICAGGAAAGVTAAVFFTRGFFAVAFPDTVGGGNPLISTQVEQLAMVQLPAAKPELAWTAVLVAALVAAATGLLAGMEPALAAARVAPAEAIRTSPVPRYQVRGALTVLQVALGVAAVLLLVSLYEGRVQTELTSLREGTGAGQIWLQFGEPMPDGGLNNSLLAIRAGLGQIAKLMAKPPKFRELLGELTWFSYFDPRIVTLSSVRAGARPLRREGELPTICGTVPNALESDVDRARKADMLPKGAGALMAEGSFFSDRDLDGGQRVCVLPASAAKTLFGSGSAVGQTVVIGGRAYLVSGVLASWLEAGAPQFADSKEFPVLIPATTFVREFAGYEDNWYGVVLHVGDVMEGPKALQQLRSALLPRLRLPRNVYLFPRGALVSAVDLANRQRSAELRAAAGGLAALLIAIVGLVNMLLVSVHESVREVGLRRALGATRSLIASHFLREGALLAAAGAACGILLALPGARWLAGMVDVPVHVPLRWVLVCAIGAIAAGAAASLGPALRAATIQPVAALRYE